MRISASPQLDGLKQRCTGAAAGPFELDACAWAATGRVGTI
ncbi:MAG: hypothetical protein QOE97_2115 [Pseudonocardiales bacterium]|jgi:hypothetical protein|nr:hypothetical protein [Pseudonocardiales bacterium]